MSADENVIPITAGRRPGRRPTRLTLISGPMLLTMRTEAADSVEGECTSVLSSSAGEGSTNLFVTGGTAMPRFYIDDDNAIHALESSVDAGDAETAFASGDELMQIATNWPLRRLVEVWNKLPGVRGVTRFEDRQVAVRRIWRALAGVSASQSAAAQQKRRSGRRLNKTELVLRMLRQPEGTTLKALMKATKWKAHSVRGFLSAKVSKSLGLEVQSFRRDGERVYALPPSNQT